jgi:hypothetical protein
VLCEKAPADTGKLNEGPESLRTKAKIVEYVKGALAYGNRAILSLTEKNELNKVERSSQATPLYEAVFLMSHSMDHYGQMVEYLRMNGIVPPAGREGSRDWSGRQPIRCGEKASRRESVPSAANTVPTGNGLRRPNALS